MGVLSTAIGRLDRDCGTSTVPIAFGGPGSMGSTGTPGFKPECAADGGTVASNAQQMMNRIAVKNSPTSYQDLGQLTAVAQGIQTTGQGPTSDVDTAWSDPRSDNTSLIEHGAQRSAPPRFGWVRRWQARR
jgi:hypothetical protein